MGSRFKMWIFIFAILVLAASIISLPIIKTASAKIQPMGHPSLVLQLRAGDDPRFDSFIIDEESVEGIQDDLTKIYPIVDKIVMPEILKQFEAKRDVYFSGYIEYVSARYSADDSRLDIFIAKQPEEYGCDTEGCAQTTIELNVPAELQLSQVRDVGIFVAVYENPDPQLVERMHSKTLSEASTLLSETATVLEEKKDSLLADGTPIDSFYLRQYEDISRITILFSPFEPGGPAKEPIDVVDNSNTYYRRATAISGNEDTKFAIRASETDISSSWHSSIQGTICPSPATDPGREVQYDPETSVITDLGSDVEVTYYAISPDGTESAIEQGVYSSTLDYCSRAPGSFFSPDMEGTWTLYAIARWVSQGSISEVQSNRVNITVNPPIFASAQTDFLKLNVTNYPMLKVLDWSSDGLSILVAYDNTYNGSVAINPDIAPPMEVTILGIMNPEGTEISSINLPMRFSSITDARYSPSSDEVLLIIGGTYENPATVYTYDFRTNKLDPLADITSYAVWVPDINSDGMDDIVFQKEIRDDQDDLKSFEVWSADSNGTVIQELHQQPAGDESGFHIDDSSSDGNRILITANKKSEFAVSVNDLVILDLKTGKLDTIVASLNTDSARFAPFDGLVLYNIGFGYKTPAGPLYITTDDGSYHEQLQLGEMGSSGESPRSYAISPDGKWVVAAIQSFGGGDLYVTRTPLTQPIPEFPAYFLTILMSAAGIVSILVGRHATRFIK